MEITKDNIEKLIDERKRTYRIADNAVSAFNAENELSKEYNGRQVLELIQNADDEDASEITISIDTDSDCLTIVNDGKPFSYEGIKSILIANSSSKVSAGYIGNKGLGFRSLIYWAESIEIKTETFTFSFSRDIGMDNATGLGLNLDEIRSSRKLSETCCPFPILAIPRVTYHQHNCIKKGCEVIIKYKKQFEEDIIKQLRLIDEKTLLFLNHVNKISINGCPGVENKTLKVEWIDNDLRKADGMDWRLVSDEGELPEVFQDPNKAEKKRYNIKLAIPEGESSTKTSYSLYNYLPTQERIGLPFIIHATLDLDSSRNHVNDNTANRYILERTASVISDYVDGELCSDESCSWRWYEMLTPNRNDSSSSTILRESLFDRLRAERDKKRIFPTVSGEYVGIDEYYFTQQADSKFWDDFPYQKEGQLRHVLKPFDFDNVFDVVQTLDMVEALNAMCANSALSIEDRAQLIYYLIRNVNLDTERKPNLFIDDNNTVIDAAKTTLFTPKGANVEYSMPNFVHIKFINRKLYSRLTEMLKRDKLLGLNNEKDKETREFCTLLDRKGLSKVSDYDKSDVLRTIVSQTNKYIDTLSEEEDKVQAIKDMFKSLAEIYSSQGFDTQLERVQLLDANGNIAKASELMLDTENNRYVFGDRVKYMLKEEEWGIDDINTSEYQNFAKKLGVNKLVDERLAADVWSYGVWLKKWHIIEGGENSPYTVDNMNKVMSNVRLKQMSDSLRKGVEGLPLSKIVYLIASNDELYNLTRCNEQLTFKYTRNYYLQTEYTYLRYQFLTLPSVKNKILSLEIILEDIDTSGLPSEQLDTVLKYLTTDLCGSTEKEIADILNRLADDTASEKTRKSIRKIYKIVIDALNRDERSLKDESVKLCVYAKDGKTQFMPVDQVYYTDNTSIPQALEEIIGRRRLYYPTRQGAEKVCESLGIEPLAEFYPQVLPDSIEVHPQNGEFERLLQEIKPHILLYSTQNIDSDAAKKDLAGRIKSMRIVLVSECRYSLEMSNEIELKPMEFIQENNTFYINAANIQRVSEMQNSVRYCKLISEILSIETRLTGREDVFIRLFQNPNFMKEVAQTEFPEDIDEAKALLGASQKEVAFWKKVLGEDVGDTMEPIYQKAITTLGIAENFRFDKVDYEKWMTTESKELLKYIEACGKNIPDSVDLSHLHKKEFDDIKSTCRLSFVHALWLSLLDEQEKQKNFIRYQQKYDDAILFGGEKNRIYSNEEYVEALKTAVTKEFGISIGMNSETHLCLYPTSILNELSIDEQSIFYFPGNEDKVNEILSQLEKQTSNESTQDSSQERDGIKGRISFINSDAIVKGNLPANISRGHHPGKNRTYSTESDRQKKKAGLEAERHVRDLLKAEGYEYRWCSGFSEEESNKDDTLGYDFKYKRAEESEWRFLEVKRYNGESFIISKHELDIAKNDDIKERYDIALVQNDDVYIVPKFFQSNNFAITAENYSIYCRINN